MAPEKESFKEELHYRRDLLAHTLETVDGKSAMHLLIQNELSIYSELIGLCELFENRSLVKIYNESLFSPIKDGKTGEPILIGDKVQNQNGF